MKTRMRWQPAGSILYLTMVAITPAAIVAQTAPLRFNGQVGFRAEYMANENFAENDATRADDHRVRLRARVRIGGTYDVSESVRLGFRLSTGSPSYPSSGWSSLSDDFRRDGIAFDRAFVNVEALEGLQLRFGFNANPLFRPTELVWDGDVSPGGVAEVFRRGNIEVVAGQFMLREVRTLRADNQAGGMMWAHGITYRSGGNSLAVGAYHYVFTRPDVLAEAITGGRLDGDYRTNRFDPSDPTRFFSNYNLIGTGVQVRRGAWTLAGDAVLNTAAAQSDQLSAAFADRENLAAGGMITYAATGGNVRWSIGAGFFHIEADAVLAAFNSDDLQQTNVNSIPVMVRLNLPNGTGVVWDTYMQRKIDTDLASNGGIIHAENATKVRTRITISAGF